MNRYSFAGRVKQLRESRNLSKTALARQLGVTTTCVWNWEEGNTEPRQENLVSLSEALRAPLEYLRSGTHWSEAPQDDTWAERAGPTLPEMIAEAKARIARSAGITPERVIISLEY